MPDDSFSSLIAEALPQLQREFSALPSGPAEGGWPNDPSAMSGVLAEVSTRMANNYPYFHPLYAGQMMKPPHPIARAAYAMAMWINPNNHSLDGGRASSRFEVEAVAEIAAMFGWEKHLGHLDGRRYDCQSGGAVGLRESCIRESGSWLHRRRITHIAGSAACWG